METEIEGGAAAGGATLDDVLAAVNSLAEAVMSVLDAGGDEAAAEDDDKAEMESDGDDDKAEMSRRVDPAVLAENKRMGAELADTRAKLDEMRVEMARDKARARVADDVYRLGLDLGDGDEVARRTEVLVEMARTSPKQYETIRDSMRRRPAPPMDQRIAMSAGMGHGPVPSPSSPRSVVTAEAVYAEMKSKGVKATLDNFKSTWDRLENGGTEQ